MTSLNIHASCVRLGRAGVLLLGPSASGKSDLALRLIGKGARLVSDDRTELFLKGGVLHARPPRALAGLLEIAGLGIIAQPHAAQAAIKLAVQLGAPPPRLPKPRHYTAPAPLAQHAPVPLIALDGFQASAPDRIGVALTAFSRTLFRDTANPK
jgi:hypothetical protein